ncbi:hypothetical protein BIV57_00765 [Mangrovactinospora gilvigrisea]|uniref:Uncharacterized protein n=2 Tax=Mangrovactinospora gilvigrisea TaxID=1428644 RepID=A0A1J7BL77_9ACTN|nr:hypothetical protein BIV57_00765 [Mangrovactinospora gilvigrisea]
MRGDDAPPDADADADAVQVTITGPPERAAAVSAWLRAAAGHQTARYIEPIPGGLRIHMTIDVPDS